MTRAIRIAALAAALATLAALAGCRVTPPRRAAADPRAPTGRLAGPPPSLSVHPRDLIIAPAAQP